MPFIEEEAFYGPVAIPQGMEVTPEPKTYNASVLGAAFRQENEIVSAVSSYQFDPQKPFDPDYRPWEEIQGTDYERYGSRFVGAQDSEDVARMKAQIDREIEDRNVIDAAGWGGFAASMGAAILSPTSLIPGGAIVKGAKGVSIGKTALKIGAAASVATGIQEAFLHGSQQTRTATESAFAIGGSFILGGMLGAAAGKMGAAEFKAAGKRVEEALTVVKDYDDALRSVGAAENRASMEDLQLRGEKGFQFVNKIPVVRGVVRSDPILRAQLSPNVEARRALIDMVETPLQYKINEDGRGPRGGESSVEARIRDRERTELSQAISGLQRSYAEYSKDGPVGMVGTITAPITTRFANLMGKDRKLTSPEFMEEVGKAMRRGDRHPIPQVQAAADALRQNIFEKIKDDAVSVGIFDEDLQVKNAESYFTRSYNVEKIKQHLGDGTENDIMPKLIDAFQNKRAESQRVLDEDDTLNRREIDLLQQREVVQQNRRAFDMARNRAVQKRERAKGAISRDGAVSRVSGRLRAAFKARQDQLSQGVPDKEAQQVLKEMIADARGLKRLEPLDILAEIRRMGGIKEDGSGELKAALDTKYLTIYRKGGLDPDYAREALEESGYLGQGATVNDMYDVIRRAADGEKVYSQIEDAADIARYEAALEFADEMDRLGVDLTRPFDEIVEKLYGRVDIKKAKAGEAGRAARRVEKVIGNQAREEPPLSDGFVRMYHGGDIRGADAIEMNNFTTSRQQAESYANGGAVYYVDVPKSADELESLAINDFKSSLSTRIDPDRYGGAKLLPESKMAGGSLARVEKAMDRLEDAKARIAELDEEIGPKVRQEIRDAVKEAQKLVSEIRDLKKKKASLEFYASKDDTEIATAVDETVRALTKMKPGEHSYGVALASPTRARVLDVDDTVLEPWLNSNAEQILSQYFRSMVPDIELARKFGDAEAKGAIDRMQAETLRMMKAAKSPKERKAIEVDGRERVSDFIGMRDRLRGRYGVPENPRNGWIVANRVGRTLSYTGYLGGMMLSAVPDVAGVIGRGGIQDAFGAAATAITNPKRLFASMKEAADFGAHAEWWLNSRAISLSETFDPYASNSKLERILGEGARGFSVMTGMIPWNVGLKSIGGAAVATRMGKAIMATAAGKATKKQKLILGANGIEPWMAGRIAKQIEAHGDRDGGVWLLHGAEWTDDEAFKAFQGAMNREFDLMVVTPGQDKPLSFSTETGKFFFQFKSFAMSSHHRVLLAGLQRADADVLAQVTTAILLGGLVSNIKAWQGGYEPKEGTAFWEDAVDRSGLAGWLFEPYAHAGALSGGRISLSGEPVSRFQSRSKAQGVLGPTVDMGVGMYEALNAMSSGNHTYRDMRKIMRPIPGNNIWYLLPLFRRVEDAMVNMTGAKPRS